MSLQRSNAWCVIDYTQQSVRICIPVLFTLSQWKHACLELTLVSVAKILVIVAVIYLPDATEPC